VEWLDNNPAGIVLRMTWKVQVCPKRTCSLGVSREGELREQTGYWLVQVHLEGWPLNSDILVLKLISVLVFILFSSQNFYFI